MVARHPSHAPRPWAQLWRGKFIREDMRPCQLASPAVAD